MIQPIKLLKSRDPTNSNPLTPPPPHTHTQPTPLARPHRGPDDMYVVVVSSKDGIYRIRGRDPTKNKEVCASSHKVLFTLVFCATVNLGTCCLSVTSAYLLLYHLSTVGQYKTTRSHKAVNSLLILLWSQKTCSTTLTCVATLRMCVCFSRICVQYSQYRVWVSI